MCALIHAVQVFSAFPCSLCQISMNHVKTLFHGCFTVFVLMFYVWVQIGYQNYYKNKNCCNLIGLED